MMAVITTDDWTAAAVAGYALLVLVVVPWIFKLAGKDI
jgi:hypothetical protein